MAKKNNNRNRKSRSFQSITLAISTSLVLILIGIVVLSVLSARNLSAYVKENLTVSLLLQQELTTSQGQQFCEQLRNKPYISTITYISKEQALKDQEKEMGVNPSDFVGANPFSAEIELHLAADYANNDSLGWIKKELAKDQRVAEVTCMDDLVEQVNYTLKKINIGLLILAAILTIVSFSLINNTVRLGVYARRFAIRTMKLVGASWSFIRWPFLRSALIIGLIASFVTCAVLGLGIYTWVATEPDVLLVVTYNVMLLTAAAVFVFGILITFFCAYFSVNKFLNMKAGDLYKI